VVAGLAVGLVDLLAARAQGGAWTTRAIRWFVGRYGVNMAEAEQPDPAAYPTFNQFFTRALKPQARPIESEGGALACPADGAISQLGAIADGRIVQAKGMDFGVAELLNARGLSIPMLQLGLPDAFFEHASREELLAEAGLDPAGIERAIRARFGDLIATLRRPAA